MKNKLLIAFYSFTSLNKKLAHEISQFIKADLEEIRELKSREGKWGYIKGGFETVFGIRSKIAPTKFNPKDYSLTLVITPLWASSFPPAIRQYLFIHQKDFCKLGLLSISARGELNKNIDKQFAKLVNRHDFPSLLLSEKEFNEKQYKQKLDNFLKLISSV